MRRGRTMNETWRCSMLDGGHARQASAPAVECAHADRLSLRPEERAPGTRKGLRRRGRLKSDVSACRGCGNAIIGCDASANEWAGILRRITPPPLGKLSNGSAAALCRDRSVLGEEQLSDPDATLGASSLCTYTSARIGVLPKAVRLARRPSIP